MHSVEGALLGISDGKIRGWAWDASEPGRFLEVEIWAGARLIGRARADLVDPELAQTKGNEARHAFELSPGELEGVEFPVTIFARAVGADAFLSGSIRFGSREEMEWLLLGRSPPAERTLGRETAPGRPDAEPVSRSSAADSDLERLPRGLETELVQRIEAFLTLFRDETERQLQVLERELAALHDRLDRLEAARTSDSATAAPQDPAPTDEATRTDKVVRRRASTRSS